MSKLAAFRSGKSIVSRHLALVALAAMAWTGNAAAEKFLVLSLVGDHVTLVSEEKSVGSHLDKNQYDAVKLGDTFLDDAALLAVKGAVIKLRPAATVELLRARDPKAYVARNAWLEQDSSIMRELMANLSHEAEASPDVHLILVAPLVDAPRMKGDEANGGGGRRAGVGYVNGTGRVAGLGFYTGSGLSGISIFVNLQLALVDLRSGAIEAHERVNTGVENAALLLPNAKSGSTLSGTDKLLALQTLLSDEIARQVPVLLQPLKQ